MGYNCEVAADNGPIAPHYSRAFSLLADIQKPGGNVMTMKMKRHSPHPKASHVIWLSLLALGLSSAGEAGEGRVQLELYGERGQSALTFQQWAQALG